MYEDNPNITVSTGEETEEETPPPTDNPMDGVIDALQQVASLENAHADCVTKMTEQQATIAELRAQVDTLRYTQIDGSDSRLADFWEKAHELAVNANHCDIFDDLVEALGGPRRRFGYTVTLAITGYINIDVEAVDAGDAIDEAREAYRNGYVDNDFGNLDGVDEDWYNAEAERND
jgi:hypothetical protein